MTKQQRFTISFVAKIWAEFEIKAESLEKALEYARTLKTSDVLDSDYTTNDSGHKIVQVYDPDFDVEL